VFFFFFEELQDFIKLIKTVDMFEIETISYYNII